MAQRWMQPKLTKMRKARKSYPRWVKSGGVDRASALAYDIYNNKGRVRSTVGQGPNTEPKFDNSFQREVPRTKSRKERFKEIFGQIEYDPSNDITHDDVGELYWDEEYKKFSRADPPRKKVWEAKHVEMQIEQERKDRVFVQNSLVRAWSGKTQGSGVEKYSCIVLSEWGSFSLKLYFYASEYVFVQETDELRWMSRTHPSYAVAMALHKQDMHGWVTMEKKQNIT